MKSKDYQDYQDYQKYKKYKSLYKNHKYLKGGTLVVTNVGVPGYPFGFRPKHSASPLQKQQNLDQYKFYVKLCECISIIRNEIVPNNVNLRGDLEKYSNSRFLSTNRNFTPATVPSNPAEWATEISNNFKEHTRNNNRKNPVEYRITLNFLDKCFEYLDEYGNFVFDVTSPDLRNLMNLLNQLIHIRKQGNPDAYHLAYVRILEMHRIKLDQIFAKQQGEGWYDLGDRLPTNTKSNLPDRHGDEIMSGQRY